MAAMALTLRADTPIRATTVPALLGFIRDLAGGAPVTTGAASMDVAVIGGSNSSRQTGRSRKRASGRTETPAFVCRLNFFHFLYETNREPSGSYSVTTPQKNSYTDAAGTSRTMPRNKGIKVGQLRSSWVELALVVSLGTNRGVGQRVSGPCNFANIGRMSPEMLHALCVSLSGSFQGEYVFVPGSQPEQPFRCRSNH